MTLGASTKSSSDQTSRDVDRTGKYTEKYDLLSTAQDILDYDNHRICMCCQSPVPDEVITINRSPEGDSAGWAGLMKCGNVWGCPVCGPKISAERGEELRKLVAAAKSNGWHVSMMTNTLSHHKRESLVDVHTRFNKAWRQFTSGRWRANFYSEWGIVGTVKAIEVTYGANGWHVHSHTLLIAEYEPIPHAMQEDALERWIHCVDRQGGHASTEHGLKVSSHSGEIDQYIAKYGKMPSDETLNNVDEWDESREVAGAVVKQGSGKGLTPWQLLESANMGDASKARLWREFIRHMTGKHQLVWSNGLKGLLEDIADQREDSEIAEQVPSEIVMEWDVQTYRQAVHRRLRGRLLDLALEDEIELARLHDVLKEEALRRGPVHCGYARQLCNYNVKTRKQENGKYECAAWHVKSNRVRPNYRWKNFHNEIAAFYHVVQWAIRQEELEREYKSRGYFERGLSCDMEGATHP